MHPVLFSFGGFTVYTYGFFAAAGFFAAVLYISKNIRSGIISQDDLYSLFLHMIIAAVLGARALYVLTNPEDFLKAPQDIFKIWRGGLVYYGGFITAVSYAFYYAGKKKISLALLSDFAAPALGLGHFFGRIGCFFAGCCYGKACSLPWAVTFSNKDTMALGDTALHPTQLYEAFGNLAVFVFLHFYNKKQHPAGKTFALYLITYSVLRFVIEFFRGDYRGGEFLGLSIAQNVSVILFITGLFIIYKADKRWKKK